MSEVGDDLGLEELGDVDDPGDDEDGDGVDGDPLHDGVRPDEVAM